MSVQVFIPAAMRPLTEQQRVVAASSGRVRDIIAELDQRYPGLRDRLCQGDRLAPGISIVVNGHAAALGLLHRTQPGDELHFVPALAGG